MNECQNWHSNYLDWIWWVYWSSVSNVFPIDYVLNKATKSTYHWPTPPLICHFVKGYSCLVDNGRLIHSQRLNSSIPPPPPLTLVVWSPVEQPLNRTVVSHRKRSLSGNGRICWSRTTIVYNTSINPLGSFLSLVLLLPEYPPPLNPSDHQTFLLTKLTSYSFNQPIYHPSTLPLSLLPQLSTFTIIFILKIFIIFILLLIIILYIFFSTLKKVASLPKHTKVRELLITLNKIHSLDRIQNVYKSIYT